MTSEPRISCRAAAALVALAAALLPPPVGAQEAPATSAPAPAVAVAEEVLDAPPAAGGPLRGSAVLVARRLRGLKPEVAAQVFGGAAAGPLRLHALALTLPADPATPASRDLRLFVEIDGASLVEAVAGREGAEGAGLELYAYLVANDGRVGAYLAEAFAFTLAELGEAVWQSGLAYTGRLAVPPGAYDLRVLVRERVTGASGLVRSAVTVPHPALPAPIAVFEGPLERDPGIPVRGAAIEPTEGGLVALGRELVPSTWPVLTAGAPASLLLLVDEPPAKVEVELAGPERRRIPATVEERGGAYVVAFTPPPRLAPGAYRLTVGLGSDRSAQTIDALVAPPGSGPQRWTDAAQRVAETVTADPAVPWAEDRRPTSRGGIQRAAKQRRKDLEDGYRRALAALGRGGGAFAGRNALLEVEGKAVAGTGDGLADLAATELEIAQELAARDPETLVPVMELHAALYRVYRDRRRFALVVHSRDHVERLATLYVEQAKSTGAKVIAGRVLASLAGHLQDANLPSSSRRLYRVALELDPGNEAAALGLAASLEKYGDYAEAVAALETLLAIRPSLAEARLRLAVNLVRTNRREQAEKVLASLAASDGDGWVRALAVQESARLLVAAGNDAAAITLLESEVARPAPAAEALFLLAHLYDRRGEARRAIDLLGRVHASRGEPSPRKLYDSWPEAPLGALRRDLAAATESRTSLLVTVVGGDAAEEGEGGQ